MNCAILTAKSVDILLESKHPITLDTVSVSVPFRISRILSSLSSDAICGHMYWMHTSIRTVRVVPVNGTWSPRITIDCFPTELLLKIILTASSAKTLAQVTLEDVSGITDKGLRAFLDATSQNVVSLTIWDGWSPGSFGLRRGSEVPALDAVVDKMCCLQALKICGDVASAGMLRRRSEMFVNSRGSGVPVVRLLFHGVPGIWYCTDREWAGWEVVEL